MGLLDAARRKLNDWTTSDENVDGIPKDKIRDLRSALGQMTKEERERNVQHVKAYIDYYYVTHQGERNPKGLSQDGRAIQSSDGSRQCAAGPGAIRRSAHTGHH
jgi:hypothetical protein